MCLADQVSRTVYVMLSCGWTGKRNSSSILAAAVLLVMFNFHWKGKEAEVAFLACARWGRF